MKDLVVVLRVVPAEGKTCYSLKSIVSFKGTEGKADG